MFPNYSIRFFYTDFFAPNIDFVSPTPAAGYTSNVPDIYVNVSSSDFFNIGSVINFDDSLRTWLRMDDKNSTHVLDYLGKNNASIGGGAQITGKLGNGFNFSDGASYLGIPDFVNLTKDNFTLVTWVHLPFQSDFETVFYESANNYLQLDTSRRLYWHSEGPGVLTGTNSLSLDSWTQIALVWDVSTLTRYMYLNGTLDKSNVEDIEITNLASSLVYIGSNPSFSNPLYGGVDDFMIFNRSLSSVEILSLYANETSKLVYNNFTGLGVGVHSFTGYSQDVNGHVNSTGLRNVSIGNPPSDPAPSLNSSNGGNKTLADLNCYIVIEDDLDLDTLTASVDWFKNSTLNLSETYVYTSGTGLVIASLLNGNTTRGDIWKCGVRLYDGSSYSNWVNSSNLTILNSAPVVTLTTPANNSATTNRRPTFNWTAIDDDNDALTYTWNLTDYKFSGAFVCSDSRAISGINILGHVPTYDLKCLYDNGYQNTWRVRADDGSVNGSWTNDYYLNVSAVVSIKLNTAAVNFGSLGLLESNSTEDDSPLPIVVENNGTVMVNISVNSSALWNSQPSTSAYYQFKAGNVTGEVGAFSWITSVIDWLDVSITGYVTGIDRLNYSDSVDSAEIEINITTPGDEISGAKSANIVIKGDLAE